MDVFILLLSFTFIVVNGDVNSQTGRSSSENQDGSIPKWLLNNRASCLSQLGENANPRDGRLYCNGTWDSVLCWPATQAGKTAKLHCPPWRGLDPEKYAYKTCSPDGRWEGRSHDDPSSWTNYTACVTSTGVEQGEPHHSVSVSTVTEDNDEDNVESSQETPTNQEWYFSSLDRCLSHLGEKANSPDGRLYCNGTWDTILCWPATQAGETAQLHCPPLEGLDPEKYAYKTCRPDGRWEGRSPDELSRSEAGWTNYTACYTRSTLEKFGKFYAPGTRERDNNDEETVQSSD